MNQADHFIPTKPGLQDDESEISMFEVFHTLWFRRRFLLTVSLFITIIGVVILYQQPLRYTATSSILVGLPKSQIVDIKAIQAGATGINSSGLTGEIEVLRSRVLAEKVAKKFDLVSRPEFNPALRTPDFKSYLNPIRYLPESWKLSPAQTQTDNMGTEFPEAEGAASIENQSGFSLADYIPDTWKLALGGTPPEVLSEEQQVQQRLSAATSILLSKLRVSIVGFSNVLNISFESLDPGLAASIANEIPEAYVIGKLEANFEATEKATSWLNDQLTLMKAKVEDSENAVQLYREQFDISEAKGGSLLEQQLSAISSQLIIARAERAEATARLQQVRKLTNGKARELETASEVLSSALIQRLRDQEAVAARKATELSTEYGAKHPKMIQARAEIQGIQKRIRQEINKIAGGLENKMDLIRIRERSLETSLDELKRASGQKGQESVQLRSLEREASANRALYETFLNRFKEANSVSSIQEADARVISNAVTPGGASYPKKRRTILLIVLGALLFSSALVFLIQALTSGLMGPDQVERELGLSLIGLIPQVKGVKPFDYILKKPHSSYGESLNSLRTSLILSGPDEAIKTLQITSSIPEEGKSTLALSFGRLLAMSGKKVVLVDSDLRRASLEKKMNFPENLAGLTDLVMSKGDDVSDFLIKDEKSGLMMMPKGKAKYVNASDILSSHRMEAIVAFLRQKFDYVLFDTPPVMAVSDAKILGRLVDKTIFVVRWDKTPKKVVQAALKQLQTHDVDIAGCVLQQVNLKRCGQYGYGDSGYYYHYSKYGAYYTS